MGVGEVMGACVPHRRKKTDKSISIFIYIPQARLFNASNLSLHSSALLLTQVLEPAHGTIPEPTFVQGRGPLQRKVQPAEGGGKVKGEPLRIRARLRRVLSGSKISENARGSEKKGRKNNKTGTVTREDQAAQTKDPPAQGPPGNAPDLEEEEEEEEVGGNLQAGKTETFVDKGRDGTHEFKRRGFILPENVLLRSVDGVRFSVVIEADDDRLVDHFLLTPVEEMIGLNDDDSIENHTLQTELGTGQMEGLRHASSSTGEGGGGGRYYSSG